MDFLAEALISVAKHAAVAAVRGISAGIADEQKRKAMLDRLFNEALDRRVIEVEAVEVRDVG